MFTLDIDAAIGVSKATYITGGYDFGAMRNHWILWVTGYPMVEYCTRNRMAYYEKKKGGYVMIHGIGKQ